MGFLAEAKPLGHSTFPHAPNHIVAQRIRISNCLVAQHETRETQDEVYARLVPEMQQCASQIT
jgi:hypothetical protein